MARRMRSASSTSVCTDGPCAGFRPRDGPAGNPKLGTLHDHWRRPECGPDLPTICSIELFNADGNGQGRLTDIDIIGVRSIYGTRTHFAPSAVVLLGDGQMWRFTGRRCNDTACPGWQLIDKDARVKSITASDSTLFARLGTGQIYVWDGHTPCNAAVTACPGWTLIDFNTRSTQIVASGNSIFQLQGDGSIWQGDGRTPCTTTACPGWWRIDTDARIASIAASDSKLFARLTTGQVWTWDGQSRCTGAVCPGWTQLDSNTRSTQIAAAGNQLFQLQVDGKIWQGDGQTAGTTACPGSDCPGWKLVDNDGRIKSIAATSSKLFARQGTGELWVWDGSSKCTTTECPGWFLIDSNTRSRQIAASDDRLFQLHVGGYLWRWDGKSDCKNGACPGWTLINRDAQIVEMRTFVPVSEPSRLCRYVVQSRETKPPAASNRLAALDPVDAKSAIRLTRTHHPQLTDVKLNIAAIAPLHALRYRLLPADPSRTRSKYSNSLKSGVTYPTSFRYKLDL